MRQPQAAKASSPTAVRTPSGYRLDGVKSLVPAAADAELFVVAAQLNGRPAMFIVEASSPGVTVTPDRSMGLRAAALGRVTAKTYVMPIATDMFFPPVDCEREAKLIPGAVFRPIQSIDGHLALFGADPGYVPQLDAALNELLATPV